MSNEIIEVLQELARSAAARPVAARLNDYIEEIDAAITAGVRPEAIEKALADFGIVLSPTALRGALYRFRRKRKTKGESVVQTNRSPGIMAENKPLLSQNETAFAPGVRSPPPSEPKPGGYKSDLTFEEKEILKQLTPTEKIEFFRQRASQQKFTHNPTPERFREKGE